MDFSHVTLAIAIVLNSKLKASLTAGFFICGLLLCTVLIESLRINTKTRQIWQLAQSRY